MGIRILNAEYRPHFAGHETFHLRYGWLKKAYDVISEAADNLDQSRRIFVDEDAIARFGVGKNMVSAIRYWAHACGVLETNDNKIFTTDFGDLIFSDDGLDPYLENPSSLWVLHWKLASQEEKTSFFWTFNYFNEGAFEKRDLANNIIAASQRIGWKTPNAKTLDADIQTLINTYAMNAAAKMGSQDDSLTSPLAELGLIRRGATGRYHMGWGPKPSLSNGAFLYALCDFWRAHSSANTLNFQSILLEAGSPGRIFLMDENELANRLLNVEEDSNGTFAWSETAGMKQISAQKKVTSSIQKKLLSLDYAAKRRVRAA